MGVVQEPAGRTVGKTDKFKVNPRFTDRMRKLRVSGLLSLLWCFLVFEAHSHKFKVNSKFTDSVRKLRVRGLLFLFWLFFQRLHILTSGILKP